MTEYFRKHHSNYNCSHDVVYILYIYIYIFCPEHTYLVSAQFRHLQPAECHKPVRRLHKPSNLLQWFWYAWVLTLIYFVNLCQIFPTPRWLRRISSNSSLESPPPSQSSPVDLCPGSLRQNSQSAPIDMGHYGTTRTLKTWYILGLGFCMVLFSGNIIIRLRKHFAIAVRIQPDS